MQLSLTPILLAVELLFLLMMFRNVAGPNPRPSHLRSSNARMFVYWLWLLAYSVLVSYLGYRGVYTSEAILPYLPALWLQSVTVAACVMPVLSSSGLRNDLRTVVDQTPRSWLIYFHMLRFAALGTMLGAARGTFPVYFELLVGVPDLIFATSALWVLRKHRAGTLTDRTFLLWNLAGALVIVPITPIVLQMGLPGPLQYFTSQPDARAVFSFPMAIAPMISVPILVLVNLLVVWRLATSAITQNNSM
ncbi:MAG: hypothetical protein MI861_15250 [Pirellulales bacterium]|nr:hypothetical protein [Pirellulales bacterium]